MKATRSFSCRSVMPRCSVAFMCVGFVPRARKFSGWPSACGAELPASSSVGDLGPCNCADYAAGTLT